VRSNSIDLRSLKQDRGQQETQRIFDGSERSASKVRNSQQTDKINSKRAINDREDSEGAGKTSRRAQTKREERETEEE
jgi:hypothetical protein